MARCVIYHSHTGVTRALAQKIKDACGADLIEIMLKKPYNALTLYALGGFRAMKGAQDAIEQKKIDVNGYDLVILCTPVWAGKPTPAVNAAVAALKGHEGKKALLLATCKSQPGQTLDILRKTCEKTGMDVIGEFAFTDKDLKDGKKLNEMFVAISASLTD